MSACRGVLYCVTADGALTSVRITEYRGVRNSGVYNKCIVNVSFLGPRDRVLFIEVSVFQGVRISGFHCIWMPTDYAIQ